MKKQPQKAVPDFRKILGDFSTSRDQHDVFKAFVRFAACCLAHQTRETEYLEEVKRWTKPELERFAEAFGALIIEMEDHPFTDLLGPLYMDTIGKKGQDWRGEFHTPQALCQIIGQMLAGPVPVGSDYPERAVLRLGGDGSRLRRGPAPPGCSPAPRDRHGH
jgi:hypothetical protein